MNLGLVIYTGNIESAAGFYNKVFGLVVRESDENYVALESDGFELVLLETEVSRTIEITGTARESAPIKPVFFIENSISEIREKIKKFGGKFNDSSEEWNLNNFVVCDGCDIEGNVFQVRTEKSI